MKALIIGATGATGKLWMECILSTSNLYGTKVYGGQGFTVTGMICNS